MSGLYLNIPSGELTFCHGKSPFCSLENPLFQWAIFHSKMLVHQAGYVWVISKHILGVIFVRSSAGRVAWKFPHDRPPGQKAIMIDQIDQ